MRVFYTVGCAVVVTGVLTLPFGCTRSKAVNEAAPTSVEAFEPAGVDSASAAQADTNSVKASNVEANSDAPIADDAAGDDTTRDRNDEPDKAASANNDPERGDVAAPDNDAPTDASDATTQPAYSWAQETLGPLRLGLSPKDVRAALGAPNSQSDPEEVMATGDIVAYWRYTELGVWVVFAHEREDAQSPASVLQMGAYAPSDVKTSRGVGIGSSFSSVRNAYKNANDPDQDGDSIVHNDERIVVGSIYGGLSFSFENDRVTSIFIGAGAE